MLKNTYKEKDNKASKVKKAKLKIQKKLSQSEVDSVVATNYKDGPTAKIPGAEKNAPLTDWEKRYGSKK